MDSTNTTRFLDYSVLVDALYDGDDARVNAIIKEMIPKLNDYLIITMGASKDAAAECTQQSFLKVLMRINKKKIRNKKSIYTYLLKTCRHEYLRYINKNRRFTEIDDTFEDVSEPAEQIDRLMDEDRQEILKECLEELDDESRKFINYFLKNPETTTREASKLFDISGANVRTRKFRITRALHESYLKKWNMIAEETRSYHAIAV